MADDATKALLEQIEKDLLSAIVENIKEEKMTPEQAEKTAKEFLALLPIEDKHDLLVKLGKFSAGHVEGKSLFIKYAAPIEEEERQKKLASMTEHLRNGQIESAIAVAKGGTNG